MLRMGGVPRSLYFFLLLLLSTSLHPSPSLLLFLSLALPCSLCLSRSLLLFLSPPLTLSVQCGEPTARLTSAGLLEEAGQSREREAQPGGAPLTPKSPLNATPHTSKR